VLNSIPAVRQQLLKRIADRAARVRTSRLPVAAREFVQMYYHGVDEEDLAERSAEDLAGAALAHLRAVVRRRKGASLIRIYDPVVNVDGWTSPHTIVEVSTEDMPFLVDSLAMVLNQAGLRIHLTVHPVLNVRRDRSGKLIDILNQPLTEADKSGVRESWQRLEIDRLSDPTRRAQLESQIRDMLEDVRLAVSDWRGVWGSR
jgi:glutamate dehydrogenase